MGKSAKYQQVEIPVQQPGGYFTPVMRLDVCNLCGCFVGNRPAHDVFCFSVAGADAENFR